MSAPAGEVLEGAGAYHGEVGSVAAAVHKDKLKRCCTIITLKKEIEILSVTIMALQQELDTFEPGSHLLDVQEKLQKFQLQESQVLTWDTNKYCL